MTDWLNATEGEEIVWAGKPTYLNTRSVIFGTVLLCLPLVLELLNAFSTYANKQRYAVTNKAVYLHKSPFRVFGKSVKAIRLDRVETVNLKQGMYQRATGRANIIIHTEAGGEKEAVLKDVPNPESVKKAIRNEAY